jgi:hypothetical protein
MDMSKGIILAVLETTLYLEMQETLQSINVRVECKSLKDIPCNNDDKRKAFYEKKLARLKLIQDICN